MPNHEGNLGLMHRINHCRRGASATEHVADINDVGEACALAAEIVRHHDAQQTLRTRRCERFMRESRFAVDRVRAVCRYDSNPLGARLEIRSNDSIADRWDRNLACGLFQILCCMEIIERGVKHIHRRPRRYLRVVDTLGSPLRIGVAMYRMDGDASA